MNDAPGASITRTVRLRRNERPLVWFYRAQFAANKPLRRDISGLTRGFPISRQLTQPAEYLRETRKCASRPALNPLDFPRMMPRQSFQFLPSGLLCEAIFFL